MANLIEIADIEELENLLNKIKNANSELIIIKLSPYCPVSFSAEKVFEEWISKVENDIIYTKVNVVTERSFSLKIGEKFGIRHESPQVIWINSDGIVKWYGSHYAINAQALDENIYGAKV